MRHFAIAFLIFAFTAAPALGQVETPPPEKDSVTVSVESLRNLKEEFTELKRTTEIQDSLIAELDHQNDLYEERARTDSMIIAITEKKIEIKNDRIELRDERIDKLESERTWERIKRYIWTAGALAIGFLVGGAS